MMARVGGFLSSLMFGSAVILFIKAIWTVGDDSGRWGGTGVLCLMLSIVLAAIAVASMDAS